MSGSITSLEALSPRQQQVLNFIYTWTQDNGYPPSVREIGAALGLKSSSTVHRHLKTLENKGFLRRRYNKPRALELVSVTPPEHELSDLDASDAPSIAQVPVLGRVAAGLPLLAEENIEGIFPLPSSFLTKGPIFLLKVAGDSMIGRGILDGDYVLVRQQPIVENGEIAVALLDNEATVKHLFNYGDRIVLKSANPTFDPITIESVVILGKVIGVLRFMFPVE